MARPWVHQPAWLWLWGKPPVSRITHRSQATFQTPSTTIDHVERSIVCHNNESTSRLSNLIQRAFLLSLITHPFFELFFYPTRLRRNALFAVDTYGRTTLFLSLTPHLPSTFQPRDWLLWSASHTVNTICRSENTPHWPQ